MSNNIFYHMLCEHDGFERFIRTYTKITNSNLINHIDNIFLICVGKNKQFYADDKNTKNLKKIVTILGDNDRNESSTLNFLRNYAKQNLSGNSLYLHSKGVIRTLQPKVCSLCIQDWIDCMEYFLIEEHEKCLNILKTHDTCGINLGGHHYSGNFWWATNKYLASRPICKNKKMFCELRFLLPNIHNKKHKELHKSKVQWPNWLNTRYLRSQYTNKPPII